MESAEGLCGNEPFTGETPNANNLLDKIDNDKPVGDIRPTDVLCSKSKQAELHPGNKVYRHLVFLNQQLYKKADRRADKAHITNEIINKVHASYGRFIKEINEGSNQWFELKSEFVKEKVSKALRNAKDPACPKPSAVKRPAELDSTTANELLAEFERVYSKKVEQKSVSSKKGEPKRDELETGEKSGDCIKGFTNRDILSGRGGFVNNHSGNRVFRWLVEKIKDMYKSPKEGRDLLIDSILEALSNKGCRFLMPEGDGKSDIWYELSRKAASAKTKQIFRGLDHPKRASHSEDESVNSRKRSRVSDTYGTTSKTESKSAESDASAGNGFPQPPQNESGDTKPADELLHGHDDVAASYKNLEIGFFAPGNSELVKSAPLGSATEHEDDAAPSPQNLKKRAAAVGSTRMDGPPAPRKSEVVFGFSHKLPKSAEKESSRCRPAHEMLNDDNNGASFLRNLEILATACNMKADASVNGLSTCYQQSALDSASVGESNVSGPESSIIPSHASPEVILGPTCNKFGSLVLIGATMYAVNEQSREEPLTKQEIT